MPEIEFREFAAKLPRNDERRRLIKTVGEWNYKGSYHVGQVRFAKKGADLPEIVETFTRQGTSPVVDKKSGFVFGVPEGFHERFRGILFAYHDPKEAADWDYRVNAELYVARGCGYFVSSMQPRLIVCGEKYREDRFDKDLFLMMSVYRDQRQR